MCEQWLWAELDMRKYEGELVLRVRLLMEKSRETFDIV